MKYTIPHERKAKAWYDERGMKVAKTPAIPDAVASWILLKCTPFDRRDRPTVLVHADGGACHGAPLVDGRCPGCGIVPDMQSAELWPVEAR